MRFRVEQLLVALYLAFVGLTIVAVRRLLTRSVDRATTLPPLRVVA